MTIIRKSFIFMLLIFAAFFPLDAMSKRTANVYEGGAPSSVLNDVTVAKANANEALRIAKIQQAYEGVFDAVGSGGPIGTGIELYETYKDTLTGYLYQWDGTNWVSVSNSYTRLWRREDAPQTASATVYPTFQSPTNYPDGVMGKKSFVFAQNGVYNHFNTGLPAVVGASGQGFRMDFTSLMNGNSFQQFSVIRDSSGNTYATVRNAANWTMPVPVIRTWVDALTGYVVVGVSNAPYGVARWWIDMYTNNYNYVNRNTLGAFALQSYSAPTAEWTAATDVAYKNFFLDVEAKTLTANALLSPSNSFDKEVLAYSTDELKKVAEAIRGLGLKVFRYKDTETLQIGLIAQELREALAFTDLKDILVPIVGEVYLDKNNNRAQYIDTSAEDEPDGTNEEALKEWQSKTEERVKKAAQKLHKWEQTVTKVPAYNINYPAITLLLQFY